MEKKDSKSLETIAKSLQSIAKSLSIIADNTAPAEPEQDKEVVINPFNTFEEVKE
ncbi:hypothetical protein V8V55_20560 [Priestia megaterium]|uniref:hypothetical protein n=1 Tax=Priestia megaterium TaxID=1404 RepID=UPI001170E790